MADGTIKIDIDIPVNQVKSDSSAVNEYLEKIGKNAGKDMDSEFKKNAESVKREAKQTGESVDKSVGKNHKIKIHADGSQAKREAKETDKSVSNSLDKTHKSKVKLEGSNKVKSGAKEVEHDLDKIPKEKKSKIDVENSQANRNIDKTKRKTDELPKKHNTDIDATDHTGGVFARIKSHFDNINKQGEKTHSIFKSVFSANVLSNATSSAFGHIKDAIGGMIGEAKQYALEQQTMNATWLTLTNSASKGKAMVNQINSMAAAAQNSTHMVDQLSQKFYAINNSAKQTGELTKAVLTLQDAFGQSDAAVENFGTQFAQMMANGKVSAQDMMSIVNTFPKLKPMLLDYERQIHHSKNMTMAQMSDLMSKGKIKSQDMINVVLRAGQKFKKATGNFTKTIPGMKRTVDAEMPRLLQAFEGPLTKMQSPIYGAISKWVSSKKTEKEFGVLGKTVSTGMNSVMKAFSGGKTVNVTKALDSAINGINKGLQGVFGWVSAHAKDLKMIASSLGSIVGQIAKSVWRDFASIIRTIGNMFGITAKNGKGSSSAIHVIAEALNGLAKNKLAIQAISKAIVAIAVVKDLDRVGGGLFAIGEKGYGAYKNIKLLVQGMRGIKDVEGITKVGKRFLTAGNIVRKVAHGIKIGVKGTATAFKYLGKGIADASKYLGGKFVQQLKLVGKGIKGLGKGIWTATKVVAKVAASAGRFLGRELMAGFKKTVNVGKGLFTQKGGAGPFNGLLQSAHSAGGFKNLTTAGKIGTVAAGAGVAVDTATSIVKAIKDKAGSRKQYEDIGTAAGKGIGGAIGLYFGGPAGAAIGAKIGGFFGKIAGDGAKNFQKGWNAHKPPKSFWSLENMGYSAHNMWNGFTRGVSQTIKWFKKNWKEVGLYFVSPLAGAINSLYKHNPKFRKWVNGLVKGFKQAWKGVTKWFANIGKNIQKSWKGMTKWFSKLGRNMAKGLKSAWKSMVKWFANIGKGIKKAWHSMTSWFTKLGRNMSKGLKNSWHAITKFFSSIAKGIRNAWHSMTAWFGKLGAGMSKGLKATWHTVVKFFSNIVKGIKGAWNGVTGWFGKLGSNAVKGFKSAWHGLTSWFKGIIDGIKSAWDNFWGAVSGPFKWLGKVFSGKAKIGSIHFASGTDWRKRWGTPAILNDGYDSPETGNRESIIHGDGTWELLPNKRFIKRWLLPDDEVVNARDTAKFAGAFSNAIHLANGTTDLRNIILRLPNPTEKVLTGLLGVSNKQLALALEEARRKRKRDADADERHKKNESDKKHKSSKTKKKLTYSIDNKRQKGDILIDKGLLTGSLKETGKETWINEKLFKRLMSYTKAKPIKISKNSRIRYHDLPAKRSGKYYLVDSHWLTGGKTNTGKLEKITREGYLKLLQFTKELRKYKLPKKKKKRKKTTTRRRSSSTRRRSSSTSHRIYSTRASSTRSSYSTAGTRVVASVSGLKSVKALFSALKGIKGTKKITVKATAKGAKNVKSLAKAVKCIKGGTHKVVVKTKGTKALNTLRKATRRIKGSTHKVRVKTYGTSALKKLRSNISSVGKTSEKLTKDLKGKGNFAKEFERLTKSTNKDIKSLHNNSEKQFKSMWSSLEKSSRSGESRISRSTSSFTGKTKKQFSSMQSGIEKSFGHFWSNMHSSARKGLNSVIGVLNEAIGKIDTVVGQFGGNKSAVRKVARLATGTGALGGVRRPITAPTLAILNDGFDSPETGNREAIWDRNTGNVEVVPGRFTPRILKPGQEVFNATETAMLGYTSPQHFASGTGALKQLYELAKKNWEHPTKTGQALFGAVTGLTGAINQLSQGAKSKAENQGVTWWSQLWKMVSDKVNDGDIDATGLLAAAEKYGEGHRYVWGAAGPSTFDCSGLVMYTLKHKYGIDFPHYSGAQYHMTQHIPKSEAKMGDLVFWGAGGGEHVGIYAGGNRYFSAQSPSQGIHMNTLDSVVGKGKPLFGRIKGISQSKDDDSPKVKANNHMQKMIKTQVGKGFWKTISKIAEKYGDAEYGGNSITEGMIEAAARRMHVHLPDGFVKDLIRVAISETGNRNIQQQIHDVNSGGNEAQGPLQFTPQTFKAFAMPGHTNIHKPYDELLAFFNNSDWRNSIGWTTIWGHRKFDWLHSGPQGHRRFARGGIVSHPQLAMVGEGNAPESIVPWDPAQRSRALQIMQATLNQFKAQDGNAQQYQNQAQQAVDLSQTNAEIQAISDKFDSALAQLGIIASKDQIIKLTNTLDKRVIGESMYEVSKRLLQREIRNEAHRISGH